MLHEENIVIFFLWSVVCSQIYGSDIVWGAPVTLSTSELDISSSPQVVMDPQGNAMVFWVEDSYAQASYMPNGGSWGSPQIISGSNASNLCLVVDSSGNVTALWIQGGVIFTSTFSSGTWSPSPTILSLSGASSPSLAVDGDGNVLAAWIRAGNVETATMLAGQMWPGSPDVIMTPGAASLQAALGGSSESGTNTALVSWHVPSDSAPTVVYAATAVTGGDWNTPVAISDQTRSAAYSVVGVDPFGNGIAMWYSYDVDQSGVSFTNVGATSASLTYNGTWTSPTIISYDGIRNPAELQMALEFDPFGNTMAVWASSQYGNGYTILSSVLSPNQGWLTPAVVTYAQCVIQFNLTIDAFGNGFISCMAFNSSTLTHDILVSCIYVNSHVKGQWSRFDTISVEDANGFPVIAAAYLPSDANPSGMLASSVATVWVAYDGNTNVIQAATGLAPLVEPPTMLAVTQTAVDYNVFMEYWNTLTWQDSISENVAGYYVYRNGSFIAQVVPGEMQYVDLDQPMMGSAMYGISTYDMQYMQSITEGVQYPSTLPDSWRRAAFSKDGTHR